MNLVITIISLLMIIDALFTLLNLSKMESLIHSFFPGMNLKKIALVEGGAGGMILLIKLSTQSLT
ncbi:MAG: hypothetical protein OEY59_00460 [Deltaproteobacteria bacterium]|nr:hypothetical protein [Deltaproteobacteria bacterium]